MRMEFSRGGLAAIGLGARAMAVVLLALAAPAKRGTARVVSALALVVAGAAGVAAVRTRRRPRGGEEPIGTAVGDVDAFIAAVPRLEGEFRQWTAANDLALVDELSFLGALPALANAIYDDAMALLRPAIGAHGELVRRRMGGVWRLSQWSPRGELVVARPGRPWTRRRVLYEVLDALSL